MFARDRRFGFRVPFEMFLDQYIGDRHYRGLTTNLSETGIFLQTAAAKSIPKSAKKTRVAMEFRLPGVAESIWACGEICYQEDGDLVRGTGIRFTAMAKHHARLLRDFCVEHRRQRLSGLLSALQAVPEPA